MTGSQADEDRGRFWGTGIAIAQCIELYAQWYSVGLVDTIRGLGFESRQERRENCLLLGQFSVLTLFWGVLPY